jgi:hypothetical protein
MEGMVDQSGETQAQQKPRVRPWIRFWARLIDYGFAGLVLGMVFGIFAPTLLELGGVFSGILIMFYWAFIEAFCLATWGWTPGKSLLRVSVRDSSGEKLRFKPALARSLLVWMAGMGAGVPIVSMITQLAGYYQLTRNASTWWDRRTGVQIGYGKIGWLRAGIALLFLAGLGILIAISSAPFLPK